MILSIDMGNTFTDFVLFNETGWHTHKILSARLTPEETILKGIDDLELNDALQSGNLLIVHNSNAVLTNTSLEKNSAQKMSASNHTLPSPHFFATQTAQSISLIFNMGAHSTRFVLIENHVQLLKELTLDIGGEAIAYMDEHQQLQVSLAPNDNIHPACYSLGGDQPTVTDANLILGRLRPDTILGNALRPDVNSARMALATLASTLNIRIEEVALAIIKMANDKIIAFLRSTLNDHDFSQLTLYATGGCGALHVCTIADALGIKNVVVPLFGGVFSAASMLSATESTIHLPKLDYRKNRASHHRMALYGITLPVSIWNREELSPEEMIIGPAIIREETTTTFLQNGWLSYVDNVGNLLLRRMAIDVY